MLLHVQSLSLIPPLSPCFLIATKFSVKFSKILAGQTSLKVSVPSTGSVSMLISILTPTPPPALINHLSILHQIHPVLDSVVAIWKLCNDQQHGADTEFPWKWTVLPDYPVHHRPVQSMWFCPSLWPSSVSQLCDEHLKKPQSSPCTWLTNHSDHLFHQQAVLDNITHTHLITFCLNL